MWAMLPGASKWMDGLLSPLSDFLDNYVGGTRETADGQTPPL